MKQPRQNCQCLLIVMVSLVCCPAGAGQTIEWGTVTNGVQFSIGLNGEQTKLETNGRVELVLQCRNLSTNGFYYDFSYGHAGERFSPGFECVVTTPSTNEVRVDLTRSPGVYARGRTVNLPVSQKQISQTSLSLGNAFKFEEVGTYRIVAHLKLMPGDQKPFVVTSNPLFLEIRPTPPRL